MPMYNHMAPWWWLIMLLLWIIVFIGVISVIRALMARGRLDGTRERAPLEILKERYARGEVSREEFLQMRKDLE